MSLTAVDFPAPLGPMQPTSAPAGISNETSVSAGISRYSRTNSERTAPESPSRRRTTR